MLKKQEEYKGIIPLGYSTPFYNWLSVNQVRQIPVLTFTFNNY